MLRSWIDRGLFSFHESTVTTILDSTITSYDVFKSELIIGSYFEHYIFLVSTFC